MESVLTRKQTKTYGPKPITGWGKNALIKAKVRYDDECGNGHNSFAITDEIYIPGKRDCEACGMLHEEIVKSFPELQPFLKWHLVSSDEPMHYVANTLYWLGYDTKWCKGEKNDPPNMAYARDTAVWPDMPEEYLQTSGKYTREQVADVLKARLTSVQTDFKAAVESLGFTF